MPTRARHRVVFLGAMTTVLLVACGDAPDRADRDDSARATTSGSGTGSSADSARGLALMLNFRDSLPAHSGNTLRCASCHLDAGLRPGSLPWTETAARYPQTRSRRGAEETLTQRINDCIARSLAGQVLPDDSPDMQAMLAYIASIAGAGAAGEAGTRPVKFDSVLLAGNATEGREGYAAHCARCHAADGSGTAIAPALWGMDSYSIGAGMARQVVFATFVRHNMPFDAPGSLTPQQSADIAAYVLRQPRQDYPGKEADWPKGNPPPDVAYVTEAAQRAGKPVPTEPVLLPRRVPPLPPSAPPR